MKKKLTLTLCLLLIAVIALLAGCSERTVQKGYMTINAVGDDVDIYREADIEAYFDADVVDASGMSGSAFSVANTRYLVLVLDNREALENEPTISDGEFVILLYDDGDTVEIKITYSVGSEDANPTVVSSSFISGQAVVSKGLTFTPNAAEPGAERVEQIMSVLYDSLVDIEG